MEKPLVSICIPAYRSPEITRQCLNSVMTQTFQNYEVILTDDSPTDEIEKVVKEFQGQIKNLKYFRNASSLGAPQNWNEGLNRASGEYIKILHRDDSFVDSTSLQEYVSSAQDNPTKNFFFSSTLSNNIGTKTERIIQPSIRDLEKIKTNPSTLLNNNIIGAPSVTFFKSTSERFDENLSWLVDIEFYIRLLKDADFMYIDKPLVKVSENAPWQLTRVCENKETEFQEWFYVRNKHTSAKKLSLFEKFHVLKLMRKYKVYSWNEVKTYEKNN